LITSGNGIGNTTAPGDDPGFSNIGVGVGQGTYIYLGNNKVLTVSHLGANPVDFNGTIYNPVPGSSVRIKNADNSDADLVVFEIDADPGLPSLNLATSTPGVNAEIIMIGAGLRRLETETFWDVDTGVSPWDWDEVNETDPWNAHGYKSSGTYVRQWGTNEIYADSINFNGGNGVTDSLVTLFDDNGTAHEAQAAGGDSGGALFAKNTTTNEWELVGVIMASSSLVVQGSNLTEMNLPYGAGVLDLSITFAADVSTYHDQIASQVPEPATLVLAGLGLPLLFVVSRRRRFRRK
jgi:hypothetical protein